MPFWVYMLHCGDGSYYTGHTDSLEQRIEQHESARTCSYTATRKPLKLVFAQEFSSREEALAMELRIKGWSRKKKEALMRSDWSEIKRLSRGRDLHERTGKCPSTSVAVVLRCFDFAVLRAATPVLSFVEGLRTNGVAGSDNVCLTRRSNSEARS